MPRKNRQKRVTVLASDYIKNEKYLGDKEYWLQSGLTKPVYLVSNKGRLKGPNGIVGSTKWAGGIEVRNKKGTPQHFTLKRFLCEAFTTFEYDRREHVFCWLDGDVTNHHISNLGIQIKTHEDQPVERESSATQHILRIKILGTDEVIERRTRMRTVVLPNIVRRERLTGLWLVSHGEVDGAERWTYTARRKTDGTH